VLRDVPAVYGYTPLMHAAYNGHTSSMELLLLYGADTSLIDNKGDTAYNYIMRMANLKIIYDKCKEKLSDPKFKVSRIDKTVQIAALSPPRRSPNSKILQQSPVQLSPDVSLRDADEKNCVQSSSYGECNENQIIVTAKNSEMFSFLRNDCQFSLIK
jgi:hypothetical protein